MSEQWLYLSLPCPCKPMDVPYFPLHLPRQGSLHPSGSQLPNSLAAPWPLWLLALLTCLEHTKHPTGRRSSLWCWKEVPSSDPGDAARTCTLGFSRATRGFLPSGCLDLFVPVELLDNSLSCPWMSSPYILYPSPNPPYWGLPLILHSSLNPP